MKHFFWLILFLVGCGGAAPAPSGSAHVENPFDGKWQNAPEVPFSFVLEQTWGEEDGADEQILAGISSLQIDKKGNIYFLDRRANQLISFDAGGQHRWTVGQKGEGPGELNQVYGMALDPSGFLYLFNQSGTRIDRFDLDGRYVDHHLTKDLGHAMLFAVGMLDESTLIASGAAWGMLGGRVVVISTEGDWSRVTEFVIDQTGDLTIPDGVSSGPDMGVLDGKIVNGHVLHYLIEARDTTGTVVSSFSRDIDKLVRPGFLEQGNSRSISSYSSLAPPLRVTDGYNLVVANWPKNKFDPDAMIADQMDQSTARPTYDSEDVLDLYDSSNHLLYSWSMEEGENPYFKQILTSDDKGNVYALMNTEYPQIGRFRVEVNPPE